MAIDARGIALVELLSAAEEALATGGCVGAEHAIADAHAIHLVTGGDHLADELMADHEAGLNLRAAVLEVQTGAADPARLDPDDRIVRRQQLGLRDLVHPHFAGRLEGDRSHGWSV